MTKQGSELYINNLKDNFDKIYVLYYSRMHRFAKEYVQSNEEAENIIQDVFLLLWERRHDLDVQISLVSYLFSIVKNKCIDYLRHKVVADEFKKDLSLKLIALENLNYTLSSEEDIDRIVTEAVNKLPNRCKLIFLKSRIEGKKYKEIADELGISVNTVENQISIALKKLRVELKDLMPLFIFLTIC